VRVVKVILYQWEKSQDKNQDVLEDANIKSGRFVNFQNKFNQLRDSLTKSLGKPIDTNIEQKQESNQAFRDDVRWQGKDGTNAYLFMFGNNGTGYRQIRLAIYKD